jgi:competence protein ComFC
VDRITLSAKKIIFQPLKEVGALIFPENCLFCKLELTPNEKHVCGLCELELKRTYFEEFKESSVLDKLFWGRVKLEKTFALYYFNSETAIREMLHQLKYQHKETLGIDLGKKIGFILKECELFLDLDALIPVPIHHKKEFIRGYNQSELIARGISSEVGVSIIKNRTSKRKHTSSQTKKSNQERWENVASVFQSQDLSEYKHVALVDDVITTGSTIESLANELLKSNEHLKISVISLAFAQS